MPCALGRKETAHGNLTASRIAPCRLATIERRALNVVREDDLPGSEAPAAWLSYLRGGSALNLRRVLAHNDRDVATLAELLLHLSELTAADMDAAQETPLPAVEAWA